MHGQSLGLRLRQIRYDKYLRANPAGPFQCGKDRLQSTRPAECNLLTVLRKKLFPVSPLVEHESKLLSSRRTHMLQAAANNTTPLVNPWPPDGYDIEDQLFFVFRDPAQDFGVMDLKFLIQPPNTLAVESKWVRCKLIALG
jgi:hypothetical protein